MTKLNLFLHIGILLLLYGCSSDSDPDTTPPIISINPSTLTYELTTGQAVPEINVTATDDRDGDISQAVEVDGGPIEINDVGTVTLTYTVSDKAGNEAVPVSVSFIYKLPPDTTKPVITISPSTTIYDLTVGDPIPEVVVGATDDRDGDISQQVQVSGDIVNNQERGAYSVTYNVTDAAGNVADQVVITYNYEYPNAPDGAYRLVIDQEMAVEENTLALDEAAVVELTLERGDNGNAYGDVEISQVSGPLVSIGEALQGEGGSPVQLRFYGHDESNPVNIESFMGSRMYMRMPHVEANQDLVFRLDFKSESTVVYTDSITVNLTDLGEIPESGLFKARTRKPHSETGELISYNTYREPDYGSWLQFERFHGVSLDSEGLAQSFLASVVSHPESLVREPLLDNVELDELIIREGITIDTKNNRLIVPHVDKENVVALNAVIRETPENTCNYFADTIITPEGTVTEDGVLIHAQPHLCHIDSEKTYPRGSQPETVSFIYNAVKKEVEQISISGNGEIEIEDSISLPSLPEWELEVALFQKKWLVLKERNFDNRYWAYYRLYDGSSQTWYFEPPLAFNETKITDISYLSTAVGGGVMIANPDKDYVTLYTSNYSDDTIRKEKISFPTPIEWFGYSFADSDRLSLSMTLFLGRRSNGVYTENMYMRTYRD